MKAIIYGPESGGEGVYTLIREDGKVLCSHLCSNSGYAEGDLYANRPERKEMFAENEITEFVWLDKSGFTRDELLALNKEYYEKHKEKTE